MYRNKQDTLGTAFAASFCAKEAAKAVIPIPLLPRDTFV